MIDAARISIAAMSPAIVLSDAFIANAVSEWVPPDIDALAPIASVGDGGKRDARALTRPWTTPGTQGAAFRVGGIEKDSQTGNISYDPANHEAMVALRADKLERAAADVIARPVLHDGPDEGELLVIGWGSTFGAIRQATRNLRSRGRKVAHLHLRQLWPLPAGLAERLAGFGQVACAELNSGQLTRILRGETLIDIRPVTQINGRPVPGGHA